MSDEEEKEEAMNRPTLELDGDDGFYVSVGAIVAGKYRVERVLGRGGMAFVLSARHVELDQHFALKFLDERFLGNAMLTERFTQEARAACRIRSEHVARVYDVGTHDGAPFFVMEHLEGRDLAALMFERGPLAVEDAVEYVMQVCEALAVAHSQGIVHRDIKPENLFLVDREGPPLVKVLDFGISKVGGLAGDEPASRLTGELRMGTPCYMSPEQIRSTASADGRSDVWSLGVVLYELLAGREAFRADSVNAVCAAVLEQAPPPLSLLRPDLPEELVDVVMKCLEKSPDMRFDDVAELADALLPFAPSRALVWAERSSSVMRGARRAGDAPPSEAPFVRSVEPVSDTRDARSTWGARGARHARHAAVALLTVVSAAVGLVTAIHVLGSREGPSSSESSEGTIAAHAIAAHGGAAHDEAPASDAAEVAIGVSTPPRLAARVAPEIAGSAPPQPAIAARPIAPAAAAALSGLHARPIPATTAAPAPAPVATIDLGY